MNNLIDQLLFKPIQEGGADYVVIIDGEKTYTYRQILDRVISCASSVSFDKFSRGDIIACVLPSAIEAVIVFLALIYRGLIPCLINANVSLAGYQEYFRHAKFSGLIASKEKLEELSQLVKYFNITPLNAGILTSAQLAPHEIKNISPVFHEIAFCLYTSGTTGNPSLVLHRHADPVIMNERYGRAVLNLCEKDVILATSQFYFAYGLNTIFFALLNKSRLIIPPSRITPELVWQQLAKFQPTIFFSVPTMYKRLLQVAPKIFKVSSLRLAISAGENLPLIVFNKWQQYTGISILDGIGTTEVLSTFISNRPGKIKPGSTGYHVSGFTAELRDIEKNQPINSGEIGVLWIKGDTYVSYYPNNEAETKDRFRDGWFKTNDLFSVDSEGFYFYHGRVNELIKVSGIWVYPYKIEQALINHPAVNEIIISGAQEADGLTRLVAYIVLNEGYLANDTLTMELKALSKEVCAKHEYPHFIYYVNEIPKTPSGKSKRFLLAQQTNKDHLYAK